jgi:hypothetical protein
MSAGKGQAPRVKPDTRIYLDSLMSDRLRGWAINLERYGPDVSHWADLRFMCDMLRQIATRIDEARQEPRLRQLLQRYLDNHCAQADAEGMSALCECRLCLDTRALIRPEAAS